MILYSSLIIILSHYTERFPVTVNTKFGNGPYFEAEFFGSSAQFKSGNIRRLKDNNYHYPNTGNKEPSSKFIELT